MIKTEIKNLPKSEVEITGEIPVEEFEKQRAAAVKKMAEHIEIPGFRKGNAPESAIIGKIGEMTVLEEMAERAIARTYANILKEQKIDAIGNPKVSITKIAKGSPLCFTIKTAVVPEVTLPDYSAIAKDKMAKKDEILVEDKEVEDVITAVRKQRAENIPGNESQSSRADGGLSSVSEADGGETSVERNEKNTPAPEKELPELTDGFVQTLGEFKTVQEFKDKVRENILLEKKTKAAQKKRMEIMESIIRAAKLEVPDILVDSELEKMLGQFEGDISRMGLKFDEYLKYIKKTSDDLKKEWREDAERNSKVQIILSKIASAEKIAPDAVRVEEETKTILEHYKGASPDRARAYVGTILTNEATFAWLENQI